MNRSDKLFLSAITVLVVAAISSTAFLFLLRKDYPFIIEAPCDSASGICFSRDCSESDCPPNGWERYRVFSVSARDFETCADETCLVECTTGRIACTEIVCGSEENDTCVKPPIP